MFAVTAARVSPEDPLTALRLGDHPDPSPPDGWVTVTVKAASLNHHDVWTLRGVGISADRLPIVLGCDAAGVDPDGNEVIMHAVIGDAAGHGGDETLDPRRSSLSERYDGTFADKVAVPQRNLVPKPAGLSFAEAACLPTAYLTAYRMLFAKSGLEPGATVLVQGAGGGGATALILLGRAGRLPGGGAGGVRGGGDRQERGQGRPRPGTGRGSGVRVRRQAAGAGRRGHGDRRPGDVGPFAEGAAARRQDRHRGRDQRRRPARRAEPGVLPATVGGGHHHGQPRPAGAAGHLPGADRGPAADRPEPAADRGRSWLCRDDLG